MKTRRIRRQRQRHRKTRQAKKSCGGANPQCKKFINQKCLSTEGGNHNMSIEYSKMRGIYQCSKCKQLCDNY